MRTRSCEGQKARFPSSDVRGGRGHPACAVPSQQQQADSVRPHRELRLDLLITGALVKKSVFSCRAKTSSSTFTVTPMWMHASTDALPFNALCDPSLRLRAGADLNNLAGDLGLPHAVVAARQPLPQVLGVVGRRVHRVHARRQLARQRLLWAGAKIHRMRQQRSGQQPACSARSLPSFRKRSCSLHMIARPAATPPAKRLLFVLCSSMPGTMRDSPNCACRCPGDLGES